MNRLLTIIGAATLLFLSILTIIYRDELLPIIKWGAIGVVTVALFGAVIIAGVWIYIAIERALTVKAQRKTAQRDSEFAVVTTQDGQVHIRETNHSVDWRAAHVDQRVYANSKDSYQPPEPYETRAWEWWNQPKKQQTKVIEGQYHFAGEQLPNLIETIRDEPCIMIWGGRDAGKTNTALHWIANRPGIVVVCDPKPASKNPWATKHVFGNGGNYDEIQKTVYRYRAELRRRVREQILDAPELTIFVDELFLLVDVHELDIMMPIFEIITTGRDYRMHAGFTTSDKGVESLKIRGKSGLREALTVIEVRKTGYRRQVFVDLGDGQKEYANPGQYQERGGVLQLPEPVMVCDTPTDKQLQVIQRWQAGERDCRKIAREVYGPGTRQLELTRNAVDKFCR